MRYRLVVLIGVVLLGLINGTYWYHRINHLPGWLVAALSVLIIIAVFLEGAYRVWDETDSKLTTARENLRAASYGTAVSISGESHHNLIGEVHQHHSGGTGGTSREVPPPDKPTEK